MNENLTSGVKHRIVFIKCSAGKLKAGSRKRVSLAYALTCYHHHEACSPGLRVHSTLPIHLHTPSSFIKLWLLDVMAIATS
jgi:hypothetical protein